VRHLLTLLLSFVSLGVGWWVGRRGRLVLCGVGLTVAFGAMVLVPFTILGHEAMASYGDSWYVKWISYSLILGTFPLPPPPPSPLSTWLMTTHSRSRVCCDTHGAVYVCVCVCVCVAGLWNKIFWGANLSLFFILPLAYFYYEAEGLGGKGALARLYEAAVVFALVSSMLAGLVYLLYNSLSLPTSQVRSRPLRPWPRFAWYAFPI
jgi:hypothetical protein